MPHGYLPQSVLEHIGSFCDEYDSIPFVPKLHALRIALKHAQKGAPCEGPSMARTFYFGSRTS